MERTKQAVKQSHWWANDTWMTFAIDKYVRIILMRVNIKLFTSWSYVKVFAFHRLICINLNSTNQTNANRGVVTINPENCNWRFLTHAYALVTMFEKVPPKKAVLFSRTFVSSKAYSRNWIHKSKIPYPNPTKLHTHTNNEPF